MKRLIFAVLVLLCSVPAWADSTTKFAWDYSLEDEGALTATGGFAIYAGDTPQNYNRGRLVQVLPQYREITVGTASLCGDIFFSLIAYKNINDPNTYSGYSNETSYGYPPAAVTTFLYLGAGKFTWGLSASEPNCVRQMGYHLYLSKEPGVYGAVDIVGSTSKGVGGMTIDVSNYSGVWHAVVAPFTIGVDGREIPAVVSNELTIDFGISAPAGFRIVTGP